MAVDVCSEISSVATISPRISFSYDLSSQQDDPEDVKGSETESDFFFSIISPSKCLHEPCLADEIFSNGKILPTQIKKKNTAVVIHVGAVADPEPKKIRLKELLENEVEDEEDERKTPQGRSFWKFRRSISLNCDYESGGAKGVIKSIQFLSRSKSTGSVPNRKHIRISRTGQKQNCQKIGSGSLSDKSPFHYYRYGAATTISSGQKPPLGRTKSYGSGDGVRISPVLNISLPPSYLCKGNTSLFRFGSLFCVGKDKSKKKKALS